MKKYIAMILVLMLVLSMFSACGQTAPAEPAPTDAPVEGNAPADQPAETEAPAVQYKEDVVIGLSTPVTAIDVHVTATTGIYYLISMTHDRLVEYNTITQEFTPGLATEWEWLSDTELKMKLREGVTFHNGETFTADDVVFTFERIKQHEGGTAATKAASLDYIEVVNDYEIIMKMKEVNVDWLYILAYNCCIIMNREAVEADNDNGPAIGTGPWALDVFVANDYTTLKANDNYWGEKAKAKTMLLTYIPEDAARLIALETGEVDVAMNIALTDITYVESNEALAYVPIDVGTCQYLAFDSSEAPGDNLDLRLAFAYGVDKQEIIDLANFGYGTPAVANWGKFTYALDTEMEDYGYNPEKAKEHLAASGITEMVLSCRSDFLSIATVIQAQMKEIGLNVKINEVEAAALTAMSKYAVHEHEAMLYNYGWGVFGDDARSPFYKDSNVNKARIYNERIMELIDAAKMEFDEEKRIAMYQEIQQINHEQCYYLPLYYGAVHMATAAGVDGIYWDPIGMYNFAYIAVPVK